MPLKTVNREHAAARNGCGAGNNPEGRFEQTAREALPGQRHVLKLTLYERGRDLSAV